MIYLWFLPTARPEWIAKMSSRFIGKDLVCVRGEKIVFENLSFSMDEGSALVLRGPNGSGKSSLLRMMAGLLQPELGTLTRDDLDVTQDINRHRGNLHYLGHQNALQPLLTVAENIAFASALRIGKVDCREALNSFELINLAALPVRLLSAGQMRRLALARLVASPAPLWLLDEPTSSLDTAAVTLLHKVIATHRSNGGMVVLALHETLTLESPSELDLTSFAPVSRETSEQAQY